MKNRKKSPPLISKRLKNIYKKRTVLVTGHTGFKGGWLSLWLTELGAKVIGYSLEPPTKTNLFDSINLKDKLIDVRADVRDEKRLIRAFKKYRPEFVFHLAAQPLVRRSYKEPKLTYETNVMGTINVLEAVKRISSVRVCVMITSDKCYENKEWLYGYREIDPLGGYDPYSSSKGCAELVISAYRQSFFNPQDYKKKHQTALSSARAGNVIGGGDWGEDRIMTDCIKFLSKKKPIVLRNPLAIRPWQYILEPLSGYLLLGGLMHQEGNKFSDAWNFGPKDESIITVEDLVKLIIKCWGSGRYTADRSKQPHEARLLKLDVTKSRALLGWRPIYDIQQTVERTIGWYKNFSNKVGKEKLCQLTREEIRDYLNWMDEEYR